MPNKVFTLMSTGMPELDEIIQGVRPGDNIVWQVSNIEEYVRVVHPFCRDAVAKGNKLVYFRFADHLSLLPSDVKADEYHLHPEDGFESFIAEIFTVIEKNGPGAFYVFDSLSDLAVDWYSDRMLGNFFMLTCPYLYDYDTATYFALFRNYHTTQTITAIHETAQVVIDVYHKQDDFFIQPMKVYKRYSKTMYTLHKLMDKKFVPVTDSTVISEMFSKDLHTWTSFTVSQQDMWNRVFVKAQEIHDRSLPTGQQGPEYEEYRQRLLRMIVTREDQFLKLAEKYFDLGDLVEIGKHMIGTGLIGGKTVGMLLANAIINKRAPTLADQLELHDSFYIGSDVFYTYLITSRCWWVRWKQRNSIDFLEGAEEARQRLLTGEFPEDIRRQFKEVLNYFGQSPIIIRSSSLLEDAYGNSFSGKYDSIFLANQGTPEERLVEFINAVRTVYASTMNADALTYRAQRGLLDRDEQMALLIQRVSGSMVGDYFLPQAAGVGFSYNLYAWDKSIDPTAGVLRLAFGLGTHAVDRLDDDYTRIVAVNAPEKRPEADIKEIRQYAQRKVDLLDLKNNAFAVRDFADIVKEMPTLPFDIYASRDLETERDLEASGRPAGPIWLLTFEHLLTKTTFPAVMRSILRTLQETYEYPVDIEFTLNFDKDGSYHINLLQCRPYQVKMGIGVVKETEPGDISQKDIILKTTGPIIGSSVHKSIDRVIMVLSSAYSSLPEKDKYLVAQTVGRVANLDNGRDQRSIMLVGPGRWGTSTPSLGVPVNYNDIKNISVLVELAEMHEGLIPDISLGTHFFNDLVELDILYMAVDPRRKEHLINRDFMATSENRLVQLLPDAARWAEVVKVIDLTSTRQAMYLNVRSVEQKGMLYMANRESAGK